MVLNYGDHSTYASSMFGSHRYGHPASHHPYAQLNALAATYGSHQPSVPGQYEFPQYSQSVVDHFPVHHHQHHPAMGPYLYDYRTSSGNPAGSVSAELDAWSSLQGSSSANTSLNSSSGSSSVLSPTYRTSPASNASSVTDSYGHSQISPNPCAHNLYSGSSTLQQPSAFFGSSNIKSEISSYYMSSGASARSPPEPATETHSTVKIEGSESAGTQRHKFDWVNKSAYHSHNQQTSTPVSGKTRTKDKYRVVYSDTQRSDLEDEFFKNKYISVKRKAELARELQLSERQVKIWFQNRRAKERKQTKKRPADVVAVPTNQMSVGSKLGCSGPVLHPPVMHSHQQMMQHQHQLHPADMERMERYYAHADNRAHLKV